MRKLTRKQIRKLKKEGRLRDEIEIWVDRHNHKLELLRTCASLIAAISSALVLFKVVLHWF